MNPTRRQLLRHLLITELCANLLLPELKSLITHATFAPYSIDGILIKRIGGTSHPISLPLYRPLSLLGYDWSSIDVPSMKIQICKIKSAYCMYIQTPHYASPMPFFFKTWESFTLKNEAENSIDIINTEYATRTGITMRVK